MTKPQAGTPSTVEPPEKSETATMGLGEFAARLKVAAMVLSALLLGPPDERLRFQMGDEQMLKAWPLSDAQSVAALQELYLGVDKAEDLERDYLYVLRGVGAPLVEPHESVYLSRDHLLFEEETAQVRAAYAAYGFEVPQRGVKPDDHVGFEVAFMAELAGKISAEATTLDRVGQRLVDDAQNFLTNHLDRFLPQVCQGLQEHSQTRIYRALGPLLLAWRAQYQVLLETLRPNPGVARVFG